MVQRLAAKNRTEDDLSSIKKMLMRFENVTEATSSVERSEANLEFHFAISRAAGNKYFQAFYDQVLIDTIRLARVCFSDQLSPDADSVSSLSAHLEETANGSKTDLKLHETAKDAYTNARIVLIPAADFEPPA